MNIKQGKNKEVLIGEIANILTIDEWFDKFEFSNKTGIDLNCVNPRLRRLVGEGYLESKPGKARKLMYRMTIGMRLMMIERGQIDKKGRGRPREPAPKGIKEIIKAEAEAHKEAAERILRLVNFI